MAARKPNKVVAQTTAPAPPQQNTEERESVVPAVINMLIGLATVAIMALIVIWMIRYIG